MTLKTTGNVGSQLGTMDFQQRWYRVLSVKKTVQMSSVPYLWSNFSIPFWKPFQAIIFGPVLLRAPLETPLEVVAAQNQCCVKAIELLIEQELSKQRKIKEEQAAASASNSIQAKQQQLIRRITVKRLGRLKNERRYKTDRINQNQVQEALRARGNMLRSHSSPPTLRNTNAYVQNDQRKCPVFDFTDLKRGDQSEGVFTLKRNQKGRLPVRRKKKVWLIMAHVWLIFYDSLFIRTMRLIIWQKFKVKSTICKDHDIKLVSLRIEETPVREALVGFQMPSTNQIYA